MDLNSPVYFRKGLFYSHVDKISFPGLCHAALHICGIQFPLSSVSTAHFLINLQPSAHPILAPMAPPYNARHEKTIGAGLNHLAQYHSA